MSKIHINIGSNIGDRAALIERAVAALAERLDPEGKAEIRLAPVTESEPWGYMSDNRFLNLGMTVDMPGEPDPSDIMRDLQAVERAVADCPHRSADGSYVDRPIDIDLIALDDIVVDTPDLQLPHPRMHMRRFVLEPVSILDPDWRHPVYGKTAAELLEKL